MSILSTDQFVVLSTLRNQLTIKSSEGFVSPSDSRLLFSQQWIGRAPGATDLFSIWQNIENRQNSNLHSHSHGLLTLLLAVISCLLNLFSSHYTHHSYGLPIIKTLLSPQYSRRINTYLGGSHNDLTLSTLRVLNSMSNFASGKERRQVLDMLGWDSKTYHRLLNMRRKGKNEQVDPLERPDIRTLTLLFVTSFLEPTSPSSLKNTFFDQQTDKFLAIFKGLILDPYIVVRKVLSLCWEGVWCDAKVPKKVKVGLFGEVTMGHLLKLYDRGSDEASAKNEPQITADLVHHFLLALCTRPGQGVCFRDRGWYPPIETESQENPPRNDGVGGRSKVYNKILSNVLKNLKANDDLRQQELSLRIMTVCPELVAGHWSSINLTLEPRLSSRWIANIALFGRIVTLPIPEDTFLLTSGHYNPTPPPLGTILDNVFPSFVNTKAYFSRGLQSLGTNDSSSSAITAKIGLVQLCTAQAVCKCLVKYGQVRDAMSRVADALEEESADHPFAVDEDLNRGQWRKRLLDLDREVRRKVPDFQVVISFVGRVEALERSMFDDNQSSVAGKEAKVALLSEVAHRLLWLYQRCLPEVSGEARFDVGKLLTSVDTSLASTAAKNEGAAGPHNLEAVKHIHVLRLLTESEQFRSSWIGKADSSKHSNLYILLNAIALSRANRTTNAYATPATVSVLTGLLNRVLGSSILFQHSQCSPHIGVNDSEISLWLSCLPRSLRSTSTCPDGAALTDEIESVVAFLDDCIHRYMKTPYRYMDDMQALVKETQRITTDVGESTQVDQGPLPSPLLMTFVEQLAIKVKQSLLTPSDTLSLVSYCRRLIFSLSTITESGFSLKFLRAIAEKVDSALQNGYPNYPLMSKAVRKQIRLIYESLRWDHGRVSLEKSSPVEEVREFLDDVQRIPIPSDKSAQMVSAYELVDWTRLVEHPLQVEDIRCVAKAILDRYPPALDEVSWSLDIRKGLLWQGMNLEQNISCGTYVPSFELLLLHSTGEELSDSNCREALVISSFTDTPSTNALIRAIRTMSHILVGLHDTSINVLLLLRKILEDMPSRLPPDGCLLVKQYVFGENAELREIFLCNSSDVSPSVYQVLADIVSVGLCNGDENAQKLAYNIASHWTNALNSLSVTQRALTYACTWIQCVSVEDMFNLLESLLLGSEPSTVILSSILNGLKRSKEMPGFEYQLSQHIQSLLKLEQILPGYDILEDFIELSLGARLPLLYRGYLAEGDEERTFKSLTDRAELQWKRRLLPPPLEVDMYAYLNRTSWSQSAVNIICHSICSHSPSHYASEIRRWLGTDIQCALRDFATVAHAYLDCCQCYNATQGMSDEEIQLWSRHFARLVKGACQMELASDTRAACSRCLAVLLSSGRDTFQDLFFKELQNVPLSTLSLELLRIEGLSHPQRDALVDHALQWVVRALSDNDNDDEIDPIHLRMIEELVQVLNTVHTVKAHLVEPILTVVVQTRPLNSNSLKLVSALLRKVQIKPLIVNRNLQGIVQSADFHRACGGSLRGPFIDVVSELFHMHPSNTCQPSHLESLVAIYRGTLELADRKLLEIFQLFEREKRISVAALLSKWSSSGGVNTNAATSSLDALRSLDSIMMFQTYSRYPQWRRYNPDDTQSGPEQGKEGTLYDPIFVILLVGHVFSESPPKSAVEWVEVFRTNVIGLMIRALSARDEKLRDIVKLQIALIWKCLETADMLEKPHVVHILSLLRDALASLSTSASTPTPRLPSYTTLLLAHALRGVFYPSNFTYPLTARFLLQRPHLDVTDVPMLYGMLYSSTDDNGQWKKDRAWILRFLADGMQGRDDWRVFRRRHTWYLVASLFGSEQKGKDRVMRRGVLELLANLTCIPHATTSLLLKSSLLSWIEIQVLGDNSIQKTLNRSEHVAWIKILENIIVVADEQKMEAVTQGEWRACIGRCLIAILSSIAASLHAEAEEGFAILHLSARVVLRLGFLEAELQSRSEIPRTNLHSVLVKSVQILQQVERSMDQHIPRDFEHFTADNIRPRAPHTAAQLFDVEDTMSVSYRTRFVRWAECVEDLWRACMIVGSAKVDETMSAWDALTPRLLVCRSFIGSRKGGVCEWARTEVVRNMTMYQL
ncbi:nucleolus protein [Moniliophthora roreri MCA 2997]|uniref:Nucleolus protein n=1 Tax=Moniliophthora roreri (strain MCA 2997) TaxID=1381753 RepID=V2WVX2_MONRO|nr:nucleolus protein [Moniliophthora roreri MCA 2997]